MSGGRRRGLWQWWVLGDPDVIADEIQRSLDVAGYCRVGCHISSIVIVFGSAVVAAVVAGSPAGSHFVRFLLFLPILDYSTASRACAFRDCGGFGDVFVEFSF